MAFSLKIPVPTIYSSKSSQVSHIKASYSSPHNIFLPQGLCTDCSLAEITLLSDIQMATSSPLGLCSNATFSVRLTMTTLFKNATLPPTHTMPPILLNLLYFSPWHLPPSYMYRWSLPCDRENMLTKYSICPLRLPSLFDTRRGQ